MSAFFLRYPYMALSLLLAAIAGLVLLAAPVARSRALLSGLLAAPSSLLSFAFVPEYWRPARIVAFVVGPEDLLFSFSTGVLAWWVAERLGGHGLAFDPLGPARFGVAIRRHLLWSCFFLAVFLPSWAAGARPMDATFLATSAVLPLLAWRAGRAWRLAAAGGLGFSLLYGGILLLTLRSFPHFGSQWSHDTLWGVSLAAVPVEELAWAAVFGSVWPLTLADALRAGDARQRPPTRTTSPSERPPLTSTWKALLRPSVTFRLEGPPSDRTTT